MRYTGNSKLPTVHNVPSDYKTWSTKHPTGRMDVIYCIVLLGRVETQRARSFTVEGKYTRECYREGFHVTSYQTNFASHHTRNLHVGFLFTWSGIGKYKKMSRCFLFSSYHYTKLQLSDKNISTRTRVEILILLWSKSKFKRFWLFFSIPRHTKRKPSGGAKSCAYGCVSRRSNPLLPWDRWRTLRRRVMTSRPFSKWNAV